MTQPNRPERQQTRDFPYSGVTIFLLFFGVSLLDAISGARWTRVLFWAGMGLMFLLLDNVRSKK